MTAGLGGIDLMRMSLNGIGVLKYENDQVSGEYFVVHDLLPRVLSNANAVIFDVGANRGAYSILLRKNFPAARILAFEPNPKVFEKLIGVTQSSSIQCRNIALGSSLGTHKMYVPVGGEDSTEHASIYKGVLDQLHTYSQTDEIEMHVQTLDGFCDQQGIDTIDFLKIDTEGHELEVLKGAKEKLSQQKIGLIQFEFNEMNVFSRVF